MQKRINFHATSIIMVLAVFYLTGLAANDNSRSNSFESKDKSKKVNKTEFFGQPAIDYYSSDYLRYGDYIYKDNIRTVLLKKKGWDFSAAMIRYDSDEQLILRFDDLDGDHKSYYYTIIHCDALWRPSEMQPYEYIDGFYDDLISEFSHSFNTQVKYTNYKLEFPNEKMRPTIPGNYLLKVFLDNDRENLVLTRRFMIFEQRITVTGTARQATLVSLRDYKQELEFSIDLHQYRIEDPFNDLSVVIKQNGRWDNMIYEVQPRSVSGISINYDFESEIIFDGGNEFRFFDTKSLKHSTARIDEIVYQPEYREVFLRKDVRRLGKRYIFEHDINGRFYIQNEYGYNQHVESDYAMVHFALPMPAPLLDGNVYVAGEFTDWNYNEFNRMQYNYRDKEYQISLLLKQGYYNYVYMLFEDGQDTPDITMIEGNHSDTENEYTILVYHRQQGTIFDRLIGIQHFNTHVESR